MTGLRWLINLSDEEGEQTVKEKQLANTQAIKKKAEVDPVVSLVLDKLPGSKIKSINQIEKDHGLSYNNESNEVKNEEF